VRRQPFAPRPPLSSPWRGDSGYRDRGTSGRFAQKPLINVREHADVAVAKAVIRVVLADDQALLRGTIRLLIDGTPGMQVVGEADNGADAVSLAREHRADIVLMDIQMPEMDGFEAAAAIRREERSTGSYQPIIALTAHAMKGDRDRCLAAGFDSYVPKPIRSEALFAAIDEVLAADPRGPATVEPPAISSTAAFDPEYAMESAGGDEALLREILALFLDDCRKQLEVIESAIEADDARSLRGAAHSVKGAAGHFAATAVVAAAARLEAAGAAGSCRSSGPDLAALVAALDDFSQALGGLAPPIAPWQAASAIASEGAVHPGD
jgi:DNA-binding NarL/FixJ family response regulator